MLLYIEERFLWSTKKSKLNRISRVEKDIRDKLKEMEEKVDQGLMEEVEDLEEEIKKLKKNKSDLMMVAVNPTLASKVVAGAMYFGINFEVLIGKSIRGKRKEAPDKSSQALKKFSLWVGGLVTLKIDP